MIFEQLRERELLRLYSKQRSDNVIMEEGYSTDRQVESEMMELSDKQSLITVYREIHSEIELRVTDFMEQMHVEGKNNDFDMDLLLGEQKQYASRISLYYNTEHSDLTVDREQDDDDGQKDKFNTDEMTDYNAELVDKNMLLI